MKAKRITQAELITMSYNDFQGFKIALRARAWRLCGIPWKKYCTVYKDINGDIVFEYE